MKEDRSITEGEAEEKWLVARTHRTTDDRPQTHRPTDYSRAYLAMISLSRNARVRWGTWG